MLKAVIFDFDDFVFGSEGKRGKPYPDIFLKACEKLNVKPDEAVVLEDSEAGIQAASDVHIPVICIPDLKYPSDDYTSKPAAVLESLNDVGRLFKQSRLIFCKKRQAPYGTCRCMFH